MKYTDYYKDLMNEALGDSERIKWKQQVPTLTNRIIDQYIEDFDTIRQSKPAIAQHDIQNLSVKAGADRFDISKYKNWSEFETFVDYVRGQMDLEKTKGKQFKSIEVDAKPLVSANGLEIYYAKDREACIHYKGNIPYSWCVSRSVNNLYNAYRYRTNEPSFYFVKDIEATKQEFDQPFTGTFKNPWHFFVVQKDKKGEYIVTSANNDGDVTMTWDELVRKQPKLENLEQYFVNVPLTRQERSIYRKFQKGIDVNTFSKFPFKQKELYMDIFPRTITHELFAVMPDELKNKYISYGFGLPDESYELIKSNKSLMKRFGQIIERRLTFVNEKRLSIKSIRNSEWDYLFETVDGEHKLWKFLMDDLDNNIVSVLERAVSKKDKVDSEKLIDKILLNTAKLSESTVRAILTYSKNPETVANFIFKSQKGNFDAIIRMLDDDTRNVSLNLELHNVQNITEYIDVLLKLNKPHAARLNDTQEYVLPSHITEKIIQKAASKLDEIVEIFKKNNYAIQLNERDSEYILYGLKNGEEAYNVARFLILTQKDNLSQGTLRTFFNYLPQKIGFDLMDRIIDILVSAKSNFDTETIRSILETTKNPTIVMHNIVSQHKYKEMKDIQMAFFMMLSSFNVTHKKWSAAQVETFSELALKYIDPQYISDINKLELLVVNADTNKIIELMKKYNIDLPAKFFSESYVERLFSYALHPVSIAIYLIANKIPIKIKSKNIINILMRSYNVVELIDALNLLKIPIILSDTGVKNLIIKYGNNYRNYEYLKPLTQKLSTVVGRERMLNIIGKLRANLLYLRNSINEIQKQYKNYYY